MTAPHHDLGELYPFKSHFLTLDQSVRLHYLDEGQGPVVVLLHGNPTWSFYYRKLIQALSSRYRVIVPDHVGCGLSDKPQRYAYTLAQHITNLDRLITSLDLQDITLGVHDWGGAIGFGWAVDHPKLVRKFVVFNTAAFSGPCPLRIRVCGWPVIGNLIVRGLNGFARPATWMAFAHPQRIPRAVKRGYLLPYNSYTNRVAVHRFVKDIPLTPRAASHDIITRTAASLVKFRDHPMLICWGAQDFCFNHWYLQQWQQHFPKAVTHYFEQAGHYVVEEAIDEITPLVLRFLEDNS